MPGLSDQTVPGTLAGDGSPVCWPYGQTHNSSGDKTEGDRTGAGRHAAEAGRQTAWRERWCGAQPGQGVPQGRHGRVAAPEPECRPGREIGVRPRGGADAGGGDDVEALRRRVEELELENALMREVVEVVKKDPGADLRRLSNREKTMLIDRLRPRYSLRSMACLLRIAPSVFVQ